MADQKGWLEVSLTCSGELAEAVAEVFSRYAPDGIVLNSITAFDPEAYEQKPTGEMQVVAYLFQDEALEATRKHLEEDIWHLSQIIPLPELRFQEVADQDWMSGWKQHYRPLNLGKQLIILPAWVDPSLAGNRIPIVISPDMAFGTGTHPSTQLCLIALEKYASPEMKVIDIGCGSGILSIAAARLGASQILGVDNDPTTIPSAQRNAQLNGLGQQIIFEQGTHTDVLSRQDNLNHAGIVLANILAPVLIAMLESGLAETLDPGGILIMGGILDTQAQAVSKAAASQGLQLVEKLEQGDWVVLVEKRA